MYTISRNGAEKVLKLHLKSFNYLIILTIHLDFLNNRLINKSP